MISKISRALPGILFFLCILYPLLSAAAPATLSSREMVITYDSSAEYTAREVAKAYPLVRTELTALLRWDISFRPEIRLVKGGATFREMVGSDRIVAFAVPAKQLIVLDISRLYASPFTLNATLKHELCHLVLHDNIKGNHLPRWLDEGVCQWASGGVDELMSQNGATTLENAHKAGRLIPLRELETFPKEEQSFSLAYAQSRSIVVFITKEYGTKGLLQTLNRLKTGHSPDIALEMSLSVTRAELDMKWHDYLKKNNTWSFYVSSHLYTLLFILAALITLWGFLQVVKKKREYVDKEDAQQVENSEEPEDQ